MQPVDIPYKLGSDKHLVYLRRDEDGVVSLCVVMKNADGVWDGVRLSREDIRVVLRDMHRLEGEDGRID